MAFAIYPISQLTMANWHEVGRARFIYRVGTVEIPIYDLNLVYAQDYSDIADMLESAINAQVGNYGLSTVAITADGNNLNITTVADHPPELLASTERADEPSHLVCWMHVADTLAYPFSYGFPSDMWASGDWASNIAVRDITRLIGLGCIRFVTGWTFGGSLSQFISGHYPLSAGGGDVGVNVLGPRNLELINEKLCYNYIYSWKPYVEEIKAAGGQMMAYLGAAEENFEPYVIPSYQLGIFDDTVLPNTTQAIKFVDISDYIDLVTYEVNYYDYKNPDQPTPLIQLFNDCKAKGYMFCHNCEHVAQTDGLIAALQEIKTWRDENYAGIQIGFYKRDVLNDGIVEELSDSDYTDWLTAGTTWFTSFTGCFDIYLHDMSWKNDTKTRDDIYFRALRLLSGLNDQTKAISTTFLPVVMTAYADSFPNDLIDSDQVRLLIDLSIRYQDKWAWYNTNENDTQGEPFLTIQTRVLRTPGSWSQWCQEALDAGMDIMLDTAGALDVTQGPPASVPLCTELLAAGVKVYPEPLDLAIYPAEYGFWQSGAMGVISTIPRNELVQNDTTNTWYHGTNISVHENINFLIPDAPDPITTNSIIRFKLWARRGYTPALQCWYLFTDEEIEEMTSFSWDTDLFSDGFIGEATSSGGDRIINMGNLKFQYQDRVSGLDLYARVTRFNQDDTISIYNFTTATFENFEVCEITTDHCLPLYEDVCVAGFYSNSCNFGEIGMFQSTILQFNDPEDPYTEYGPDLEMAADQFYFNGFEEVDDSYWWKIYMQLIDGQHGLQVIVDMISRLRASTGSNGEIDPKLLKLIYERVNAINTRVQLLKS